jgi:hypothetical protein
LLRLYDVRERNFGGSVLGAWVEVSGKEEPGLERLQERLAAERGLARRAPPRLEKFADPPESEHSNLSLHHAARTFRNF